REVAYCPHDVQQPVLAACWPWPHLFVTMRRLGSLLTMHTNGLGQIELDAIAIGSEQCLGDRQNVGVHHEIVRAWRLREKPADARRIPTVEIAFAPGGCFEPGFKLLRKLAAAALIEQILKHDKSVALQDR